MFTGNGRQSIAAALAALVPTGGRCGVEALTYPFVKGIAARLGISLVPLAMDDGGVRPDSVQKAHREASLSAIYIQPAIQNPPSDTSSLAVRDLRRRACLTQMEFAAKLGVPVETIRNWEQGKRAPRRPARALLAVIAHAPDTVFQALAKA